MRLIIVRANTKGYYIIASYPRKETSFYYHRTAQEAIDFCEDKFPSAPIDIRIAP